MNLIKKIPIYLICLTGSVIFARNEWENPAVFKVNTEPAHSTLFTPVVTESGKGLDNTQSSHRFKVLNGQWKFYLAKKPDESPVGFETPEFNDTSWALVRVPSSWQTQGFGIPIYTNHGRPWDNKNKGNAPYILTTDSPYGNPTGCYRTTFSIPEDWEQQRLVLHFAGANSAIYVWLNGKKLGYSQGGFLPVEFDITDTVQKGKNTLVVQVLRWCDGSYLETWDSWRNSGIFRNVYIYQTSKVYILDHMILAGLTDDLQNGTLNIAVKIRNISGTTVGPLIVRYELLDGIRVVKHAEKPAEHLADDEQRTISFSEIITNPKKWSAEVPELYTTRLTLLSNGKELERIDTNTGFRRIERLGNQLLVNGKPIIFKGVNRMEIHPDYGRHVPYEVLIKDVKLMKQHNINAVRTSHYPPDPALLDLCDKWGLYVVDEIAHETNSKTITDSDEWLPAVMNRTVGLIERDKNHPCIIIWSLGNECTTGSNLEKQAAWIHEHDPSRILQYTYNGTKLDFTDTFSQTYPSLRPGSGRSYTLQGMQNNDVPVIINEYAHSMGNATGNMKEYMAIFEGTEYPGIQGGFIWDFIDQGLRMTATDGSSYFDYGSTFGKTYDENFCINGIVFPDRTPQPGLLEVKAAYQPVQVTMPNKTRPSVRIFNKNFFESIDSDTYAITWSLEKNGYVMKAGSLDKFVIVPQKSEILHLPVKIPLPNDIDEYSLNFSFLLKKSKPWAQAGHVVANQQILLSSYQANPLDEMRDNGKLSITNTEDTIVITSAVSRWVLNRSTGHLVSWRLTATDTELLEDENGMRFTAWRAPIDNDTRWSSSDLYRKAWFSDTTLSNLRHELIEINQSRISDGQMRISELTHLLHAENDNVIFKVSYNYNFMADGSLILGQQIEVIHNFQGMDLPRIGISLNLPDKFNKISWYGRGPHENYCDRQLSTPIGRFSSTVEEMYVPYIRPQANGNRTDVRELFIQDDTGKGLRIRCAGEPEKEHTHQVFPPETKLSNPRGESFQFTALPYSEEQLEQAGVTCNLKKSGRTFLTLDIAHAGIGNLPNKRLKEYQVPSEDVAYVLVFEPQSNHNACKDDF